MDFNVAVDAVPQALQVLKLRNTSHLLQVVY